jgi:hypothetical protein
MVSKMIFKTSLVLSLIIGFIFGIIFSISFLPSVSEKISKTGILSLNKIQEEKKCFKYVGSIKDAYCDNSGTLHFYFKGNELLPEGWYERKNHEDCKPCIYLSSQEENKEKTG